MPLSPEQTERYARHLLLPEVGGQGQQRLLRASVLVVGMGALGCPVATILAGAGVGRLTLCDGDTVERSNLHRQTLYREDDIGRPKALAAAARLGGLNPDVTIAPVTAFLTEANGAGLAANHDLVVEGLDRFAPRYVVNRAALARRTPLVSAGVARGRGQVAVLRPGEGPCYACLVPPPSDEDAPDDDPCAREGVLGSLTTLVGALAADLAIRALLGRAADGVTIIETASPAMRTLRLTRDPGCPACGGTRA